MKPIRRALLSVSDKTGIVDFAAALQQHHQVALLSTGGTYKVLKDAGLDVTEVSDYTGFPEMMDGRVKTLHPKVHGGLLGRRGTDDDIMAEHDILPIDMVVVNLYSFEATVAKDHCDLAEAIENIDIGGPTMLRSAAKNHQDVTVVTDPQDYRQILAEMADNIGKVSHATRFNLAIKVFEQTARYDGVISDYFGKRLNNVNQPDAFARTYNQQYQLKQSLRYGENPHQQAAFYTLSNPKEASIATATQIQGKALSYNNIADTDAALECVKSFDESACVIVKHANPCGVAVADTLLAAYDSAFQTDPTSAFGGIIAFNRELDAATATAIIERQFVEVIIAPSVTDEAKQAIANKPNVRLLSCGKWHTNQPRQEVKQVNGGILVQDTDLGEVAPTDMTVVSKRKPSTDEWRDLLFCWKVAKFVKSNAIVYAKNQQTIGVGAGQMSRVYSAKIASIKAADEQLTVAGSVMASDAFFPFRDGIDQAAEVGITAIIQPGGSIRDEEVIAAADEAGMAMVFTGMRHFRH